MKKTVIKLLLFLCAGCWSIQRPAEEAGSSKKVVVIVNAESPFTDKLEAKVIKDIFLGNKKSVGSTKILR